MLGKDRGRIFLLAGLGWLALLVAIIPGAGGAQAGVPAGIPAKGAAAQPIGYAGGVPVFQGRLTPVDSRERPPTVTDISSQVKTVDLGKSSIHPSAVPYPICGAGAPPVSNPFSMISPNGGAIGTQNAYLSLSPDVVSSTTSAAIALIGSGYTPSEVVTVYFNGLFATNATAGAANGRIALLINTGSGQGYLTVEGVGVSSGKRAGSVAQVLDAAAPVPGFGAGPHAVNEVSAGNFGALGIRFQGSSTVSFARNGGTPTNFTSNAAGYVFLNVGLANNGDTAASYTFYTSTTGSMSGVSIEERADAGTPPSGDNNLARAYMDRNILSSSGGTISLVGEGLQPGETVSLGGCTSGSFPADSNGSVGVFLTYGAGTGISTCVFTGTTSSRVGRATAQLATLAINVPSAINQPSNIQSGLVPTYTLLFDRLQASQGGTVYMDGVSQGSASTNASGYGAAVITAPTAIGIH